MLEQNDLDHFLAELDDLSCDPISTDHQLRLMKTEIKKLKFLLASIKESTKDILCLYQSEKQTKTNLQTQFETAKQQLEEQQKLHDEQERENLNKIFRQEELLNEFRVNNAAEHLNYVELAKDYYELLSETTCFYNYQISKDRKKVLLKTERFLRDELGDQYQKQKIIYTKFSKQEEMENASAVSRTSRASKRSAAVKGKCTLSTKKKKTEIWDMKSISQAPSPVASLSFDDDQLDLSSEAGSNFSFNTFSIGNETSFTFLQNKTKTSPVKTLADFPIENRNKCTCYLENAMRLVSVGTNTELPEEEYEPPSLPLLLAEPEEIPRLQEIIVEEPPIIQQATDESKNVKDNESPALADDDYDFPEFNSIGINTDFQLILDKETVERGSSPVPIEMAHKSTATVHSSTTRGTSTMSVATRNIGIQYPEFNIENIFSETLFELPECLSPIDDLSVKSPLPEKITTGTITELNNINREVNYLVNVQIKKEMQASSTQIDDEQNSFIVLGQTLFNLFLKKIRQSNEILDDDELARQLVWNRLKQQLLDQFSQLPFDKPSFDISLEIEKICTNTKDRRNKPVAEESLMEIEPDIVEPQIDPPVVEPQIEPPVVEPEIEPAIAECEIVPTIMEYVTETTIMESEIEPTIMESETESIIVESAIEAPIVEPKIKQATKIESAIVESVIETPIVKPEIQQSTTLEFEIPIATKSQSITNVQSTIEEFNEIFANMKSVCMSPPVILEPIEDIEDIIWSSIFPLSDQTFDKDCPIDAFDVLHGFDVDHDPIEIPICCMTPDRVFSDWETPRSPPLFGCPRTAPYEPVEIPPESQAFNKRSAVSIDSIFTYKPQLRLNLVTWQQRHTIKNSSSEKKLCKTRKFINTYLNSEWNDENVKLCIDGIGDKSESILVEALYETVEDNKLLKEINSEFTPPAPSLPRYQQKLIVLIQKLTEKNPRLPHILISDLEDKLFKLENSAMDMDSLKNFTYYYTSLLDLFFDGDSSIAFYFIIKSLYFYGYKAIPMIFVVIKAFPDALPKKSALLKKHSTSYDWENMSGIEVSKVRVDIEWIDSLDLTVFYMLTNIHLYRKKGHECDIIKDHELFNYLPKFYGFAINFMTAPKLLETLMKRLLNGDVTNLSFSFIILARRMNVEFTLKTMLKGSLIPLLKKYIAELTNQSGNVDAQRISQICLLVETISSILKPFTEDKDKLFKDVFPMLMNLFGRSTNILVQEACIKAILRLQRFVDNHKDIYNILYQWHQKHNMRIGDALKYAIQTFIHRKKENFFKNVSATEI